MTNFIVALREAATLSPGDKRKIRLKCNFDDQHVGFFESYLENAFAAKNRYGTGMKSQSGVKEYPNEQKQTVV